MRHVPHAVCVGSATIDRSYRLTDELVPETSNSSRSRCGFGGVARNVAENLTRLGDHVTLVSFVGDDAEGIAILSHLDRLGVDVRTVQRLGTRRTAEYVAILRKNGELAFGVADTAILDEFEHFDFERIAGLFADADAVFADCNLSAAALQRLESAIRPEAVIFAVDAVSVEKARNLPARLDGFDLIFANADEATALTGISSPLEAAARLRERGARAVIIGAGPEGAIVSEAETSATVPALPAKRIDVTGAGDALIAGTLHGLIADAPLREAVNDGVLLAALTVECEGTVHPDLSPSLFESRRVRFEALVE